MIKNFNIIKKAFTFKTFEVNDYSYDFIEVLPEKTFVKFLVNCTLPKKGQSYIKDKMNYDVDSIIMEMSNFMGFYFSVSYDILVDGEKGKNAYISPKKHYEALERLNTQLFSVDLFEGKLKLKLKYNFPENYIWVQEQASIIDIDVLIYVDEIFWEDKPVTIRKDEVDNFASFIDFHLYDELDWSNRVEGKIYTSWEDEIEIEKTNLYFQTSLIVSKIQGIDCRRGSIANAKNPEVYFNETF